MTAILSIAALLIFQGASAETSIIVNSPFLPEGFSPPGGSGSKAKAPVSSGQLEFRGVYQMDSVYYFHLYDLRERKGTWIREGDRSAQPRIVRYQDEEGVLVVESDGRVMNLEMIRTSDKAIPLPTPPPAVTTPARTQQPATRPGTVRRRVIRPTTQSSTSATRRAALPNNQTEN